ncbi:MAG: hypothetical protein K9J13_08035 [Saprospiraceae bacterium]|nr:hypothetical protein [Saprospiraceae bacterium]
MKIKIILISLLIFILLQLNLNAQEYKNEIHLGTYHYAFGSPQISYERYFNKNKNSVVGIFDYINSKNSEVDKSGYLIGLQYRFYLLKNNSGERLYKNIEAYVTPGIKYRNIHIVETKYRYPNIVTDRFTYDIETYGLELLMGLKGILFNCLTVDFSGGILIVKSEVDTERDRHNFSNDFISPGFTGIGPGGNITLGFKF